MTTIIANRSGTIKSPSSSHAGKMRFKGVLSNLLKKKVLHKENNFENVWNHGHTHNIHLK